jgi:hypothetical protein
MDKQAVCLVCNEDDRNVPLIHMCFKGEIYWICPQHLPLLIHKPEQVADKLPGMQAKASAHHHD